MWELRSITRTPRSETQKGPERRPAPPSFQKCDLSRRCREIGKRFGLSSRVAGQWVGDHAAPGGGGCAGTAAGAGSPSEAERVSLSLSFVSWRETLAARNWSRLSACFCSSRTGSSPLVLRDASPQMIAQHSLPRVPRLILLGTFCSTLGG